MNEEVDVRGETVLAFQNPLERPYLLRAAT
jgi:hypothetical protein